MIEYEKDQAHLERLTRSGKRPVLSKRPLQNLKQKSRENLPNEIQALDDALQGDDVQGVITRAHSIKGSAANLSADGIAKAARELELAGRVGDLTGGAEIINDLKDELIRLQDFVQRMQYPVSDRSVGLDPKVGSEIQKAGSCWVISPSVPKRRLRPCRPETPVSINRSANRSPKNCCPG